MNFKTNITLAPAETRKRVLSYTEKSIMRIRQDIKSWNRALEMAQAGDEPRNYPLQLLYNEIMLDAHLTSQIENRKNQLFNMEATLKKPNGEVDEEQTKLLVKMPVYRKLMNAVLDKYYYGYSLVEISMQNDKADLLVIPRTNVIPRKGLFLPDYTDDMKSIPYREMPEYGTWILEFYDEEIGLLNKAVPHVLFKRFAQSCWSELCEIYGIPPRVMKTNTSDGNMLRRAEKMMAEMGAAAYFIIDETENFEWAKAADTNGDVYANLMSVCRDEMSLLISGAVIGQDTKYGSNSKENASQNLLWELVKSDMMMAEQEWNDTIIPALQHIGIIKGDVTFAFQASEDIDQLFKFTTGLLPFKSIDDDWIKEKFGVEVTGDRQQQNPFGETLNADFNFFD